MESNITRDHIALEAMKIIAKATVWNRFSLVGKIMSLFGMNPDSRMIYKDPKACARIAYEYADAMIAEREKEKSVEE